MPAIDQSSSSASEGKTILVVEDDPLVRSMLCLALRRFGHRVIAAADGYEGRVFLEREVHAIDLLLTDISLPIIRGPELAKRALALRPDMNVAFASGSFLPEEVRGDEQVCPTLRNLPFLRKPFTMEELRVFVEEATAPVASGI